MYGLKPCTSSKVISNSVLSGSRKAADSSTRCSFHREQQIWYLMSQTERSQLFNLWHDCYENYPITHFFPSIHDIVLLSIFCNPNFWKKPKDLTITSLFLLSNFPPIGWTFGSFKGFFNFFSFSIDVATVYFKH